MLLHTCKFVVITSLSAVFLAFFGYPSYVKYLNQDTVFTESSVKFDPQKPVGITIFAWQTYKFYGWKDNKNTFDLKCFGNESTDFHKVVQCINNGTFKHDDIIEEYMKVKTTIEKDITKDTIYTEDISFFFVGKAHSFNISFAEEDDLGFSIYFKPGYNYSIFIHDPHFFHVYN